MPSFFASAVTTGSNRANNLARIVQQQHVVAAGSAAGAVLVQVVFRAFHRSLGLCETAVIPCRPVRVVLRELVVEDRVGDDVAGDLPDKRAAADLAKRILVHDPVHGTTDMDVVERRLRQVHGEIQRSDDIAHIRVDRECELVRKVLAGGG
jgi:hypothetical protein